MAVGVDAVPGRGVGDPVFFTDRPSKGPNTPSRSTGEDAAREDWVSTGANTRTEEPTMSLTFWKLTGAGNDFIVINNMDGRIKDDVEARRALVRRLCARRVGVGADGLLLAEPSDRASFRMRYYNRDGGEAETCGNGARCIARFATLQGLAGEEMEFETKAGLYRATVLPDSAIVSMGEAHSLRLDIPIEVDGLFRGPVDFVNTGVPHVVVRVENLDGTAVSELGRAIRRHERFAPAGANVNFIEFVGENLLSIRTYERGVEDETLACGTGAIASAVVASRRGLASSPVRLSTRSGEALTVRFEPTDDGAREVSLEGEARVVFRGEIA